MDERYDLTWGTAPPGDPHAEALRDTQHSVIAVSDAPTTLKDVSDEFRKTQLFAQAIAQARHDDAMGLGAAGPVTAAATSSFGGPGGGIPLAPVVNAANNHLVAPRPFDDASFPGHAYDYDVMHSTHQHSQHQHQQQQQHQHQQQQHSRMPGGVLLPPHGVPDYPTRQHGLGTGVVIGGRGFEGEDGQGGARAGGTWDDMKEANKSTLENSINAARRSKETLAKASRKVYLDALVKQAGGLDGISLQPDDGGGGGGGGNGNGGGGDGVDDMLPRHLLPGGDASSSSSSSYAVGGGGNDGGGGGGGGGRFNGRGDATNASARMPPRPDPKTCEVARHIDGWSGVPRGARDKYKALVVGTLDLRSFDDFCNFKTVDAFQERMEEALRAREAPSEDDSHATTTTFHKPGLTGIAAGAVVSELTHLLTHELERRTVSNS